MTDDSLSSHAHEMNFAPDPAFAAQANGTADLYDRAAEDHEGFWAEQARTPHHVGEGLRAHPRLGRRPVREVVRRRPSSTSPTTASTATSRPATATASRSTSRARPATPAPSPTPTSSARSARPPTRSPSSGVGDRGHRRHLHADDPRDGVHHARVRPARRPPLGDLRRVLRRGAAHPHRRRPVQGGRHRPTGSSAAASPSPLKPAVDEALPLRRTRSRRCSSSGAPTPRSTGSRAATCGGTTSSTARPTPHEAQPHDSEHPLFILYTSGTTGKPKGIFHTSGGYLTQVAYTNAVVHDVHPETDVYWCTADVGWVTGHSLHRLRPARQRRDPADVRGHPRHPAPGPLVGAHREVQASRSSTPRRRRSARS